METSFSYDEEYLVFQFVGKGNVSELQTAAPSGNFYFLHGVEDVAELFDFLFRIFIGRMTLEAVELFVVVIFNLLAYGCQQTFLFADLMLSAAFILISRIYVPSPQS